jgi:hypothetical protein
MTGIARDGAAAWPDNSPYCKVARQIVARPQWVEESERGR